MSDAQKKLDIKSPADSIKNGIGFISEDRQASGLALPLNILCNTTFLKLPKKHGFLDLKKEKEIAGKAIDTLKIKATGYDQVTARLSGGNQQKIVIAKWLGAESDILIFTNRRGESMSERKPRFIV